MSETNEVTINSYNSNILEYISESSKEVPIEVKEWIDLSLKGLPLNSRILELGTSFGRDANYIEEFGYSVERTDAVAGFVGFLQEIGYSARILNAIEDEIIGPYNMVFANAVLLHFTKNETKAVIKKIQNALSSNGRFAFSLKQGKGEEWLNDKLNAPRYFCYWSRDDIAQLLEETGFKNIQIIDHDKGKEAIFLHIIADKSI